MRADALVTSPIVAATTKRPASRRNLARPKRTFAIPGLPSPTNRVPLAGMGSRGNIAPVRMRAGVSCSSIAPPLIEDAPLHAARADGNWALPRHDACLVAVAEPPLLVAQDLETANQRPELASIQQEA